MDKNLKFRTFSKIRNIDNYYMYKSIKCLSGKCFFYTRGKLYFRFIDFEL